MSDVRAKAIEAYAANTWEKMFKLAYAKGEIPLLVIVGKPAGEDNMDFSFYHAEIVELDDAEGMLQTALDQVRERRQEKGG